MFTPFKDLENKMTLVSHSENFSNSNGSIDNITQTNRIVASKGIFINTWWWGGVGCSVVGCSNMRAVVKEIPFAIAKRKKLQKTISTFVICLNSVWEHWISYTACSEMNLMASLSQSRNLLLKKQNKEWKWNIWISNRC